MFLNKKKESELEEKFNLNIAEFKVKLSKESDSLWFAETFQEYYNKDEVKKINSILYNIKLYSRKMLIIELTIIAFIIIIIVGLNKMLQNQMILIASIIVGIISLILIIKYFKKSIELYSRLYIEYTKVVLWGYSGVVSSISNNKALARKKYELLKMPTRYDILQIKNSGNLVLNVNKNINEEQKINYNFSFDYFDLILKQRRKVTKTNSNGQKVTTTKIVTTFDGQACIFEGGNYKGKDFEITIKHDEHLMAELIENTVDNILPFGGKQLYFSNEDLNKNFDAYINGSVIEEKLNLVGKDEMVIDDVKVKSGDVLTPSFETFLLYIHKSFGGFDMKIRDNSTAIQINKRENGYQTLKRLKQGYFRKNKNDLDNLEPKLFGIDDLKYENQFQQIELTVLKALLALNATYQYEISSTEYVNAEYLRALSAQTLSNFGMARENLKETEKLMKETTYLDIFNKKEVENL